MTGVAEASAQQTIEVGVMATADRMRASHLRDDQAWSERYGMEQRMLATRFATASFSVCGDDTPGGLPGRRRRNISQHVS